LNEHAALTQFAKLEKGKCAYCFKPIISGGIYPNKFTECDANNVCVEVCGTCFDNNIKKRQGFY